MRKSKPRPLIVHAKGVLAVPLPRNQIALIDESSESLVAPFRWCVVRSKKTDYAIRHVSKSSKMLYMHRIILGLGHGRAPEVDHIDGNGLNNLRKNLRLATHAQNMHNARNRTDNSSGFRGVHWEKRRQKWVAACMTNGVSNFLGYFDKKEDAIAAYADFVTENRGEFARPHHSAPVVGFLSV